MLSIVPRTVSRVEATPTPTIDRPQHTVDKYTLENKTLAAITRRDPTIVARIWPVAEALTALILLDNLVLHYGYQTLRQRARRVVPGGMTGHLNAAALPSGYPQFFERGNALAVHGDVKGIELVGAVDRQDRDRTAFFYQDGFVIRHIKIRNR